MPYAKLKNRVNLFLVAAVVLTAAVLVQSFETPAAKFERVARDQNVRLQRIKIRNLPLIVNLARTPTELQRGLAGRSNLGQFEGMLFVYERDARPTFWMKEMSFPIDILWIDKNLKVAEIKANASPETYPQTFSPDRPIRYVLEINAGLAADFHIRPGDEVKLML